MSNEVPPTPPSGEEIAVATVVTTSERPPRRRFFGRRGASLTASRRGFVLATLVSVVVILALVVTLFGKWSNLNPFHHQVTKSSTPVVLLSIQKLSQYDAAEGHFETVVTINSDVSYIPDFLYSNKVIVLATGSVTASVDFSHLDSSSIKVSADNKTVAINLPTPQLSQAQIDLNATKVYSESRGFVNAAASVFKDQPDELQDAYIYAQQQITQAALSSPLVDDAEKNTTNMLDTMLRALGFTTVTVTFPPES